MREAAFVQRNKEKWQRLEQVLAHRDQGLSADESSATQRRAVMTNTHLHLPDTQNRTTGKRGTRLPAWRCRDDRSLTSRESVAAS